MLKNYVKVALKVFWRHKFFTAVNLLGICSTLIVSIMATILFDLELGRVTGNAPPEIHNDRTLHLSTMVIGSRTGQGVSWGSNISPSYAFIDRYVRTLETAENVAIFSRFPVSRGLHGGAEETSVGVRSTDAAFWEVFSFDFLQGRPYTAVEVEAGDYVAVISDSFAKRFFGSTEVVGKSVPLDGQPHRVVGVVVPGRSNRVSYRTDAWVPLTTAPTREWRPYSLVGGGRFSAAVVAPRPQDKDRIRAEFAAVLPRVEPVEEDSLLLAPLATAIEQWVIEDDDWEVLAEAGTEWRSAIAGIVIRKILIAAGVILLILLLPVLHLVNINISRIEERAAEIGVRKAFGGSSRALVGQFIAENVLLTLVGGLLSLPLSWGLLISWGLLTKVEPGTLNILLLIRTFAYGTLCAVFFGALSGAYPAWKMARLHPVQALTGKRI